MIGALLIIQAGIKISSVHKRLAPDKKENTAKKVAVVPPRSEVLAKEPTCESSTPSWASDHNYNAVKPEKTAAPWPPLLYKCMYHPGGALDPSRSFWTAVHSGLARARSSSRVFCCTCRDQSPFPSPGGLLSPACPSLVCRDFLSVFPKSCTSPIAECLTSDD